MATPDLPPVQFDDQVSCVKREIGYRERAYPRWVANGKMDQAKADRELRHMRAVLETVEAAAAGRTLL